MSAFANPRARHPGSKPGPQAAAPSVTTRDWMGRPVVVSFDDGQRAPSWFRSNLVPVTQIGPITAALGAFVSILILVIGLNLLTAFATPVCVATNATGVTHTCSTPFDESVDLDQKQFPDFALQNIALPLGAFLVILLAQASSDAIGLGNLDPVTDFEQLVIAWFTEGVAVAGMTRLAAIGSGILACGFGSLMTWAFLGNRDAYNTSTNALGTGLGGPELTYLANIQGDSYMIAIAIIFTALKVHTEHVAKQNSHMVTKMISKDTDGYTRAFHTIYNIPFYSIFISGINAAYCAVTVYLWGTAGLFWTRDLFNMFVSLPPVGDQDGDAVTVYNRYAFFAGVMAAGHVLGLVVFLIWNRLRIFMQKDADQLKELSDLSMRLADKQN